MPLMGPQPEPLWLLSPLQPRPPLPGSREHHLLPPVVIFSSNEFWAGSSACYSHIIINQQLCQRSTLGASCLCHCTLTTCCLLAGGPTTGFNLACYRTSHFSSLDEPSTREMLKLVREFNLNCATQPAGRKTILHFFFF